MISKYETTMLPTKQDALIMAAEREEWAQQARERDQPGSAREWELAALLLRYYAGSAEDSFG
jgi:hypothetical protein